MRFSSKRRYCNNHKEKPFLTMIIKKRQARLTATLTSIRLKNNDMLMCIRDFLFIFRAKLITSYIPFTRDNGPNRFCYVFI